MLGFCHIMGRAILDQAFRQRIISNYQNWEDLHKDLASEFFVSRFDTNEIQRIFSLDDNPPTDTPNEPFVKTIDCMDRIKTMAIPGEDIKMGHFYSFFLLTIMDTSIYEWLLAGRVDTAFYVTYVEKFQLTIKQQEWFQGFAQQKNSSDRALLKTHLNAFQLYRWTITLIPGPSHTPCTLSHTFAVDFQPFDIVTLVKDYRLSKKKAAPRKSVKPVQN